MTRFQILTGTFALAITVGFGPQVLRSQAPGRPAGPNRQLDAEKNFKEPQFFPLEGQPRWPTTPATAAYSSITGERLLVYVKELAEISHHSRDRGEQLWGRITGSPADAETAQWVMTKLRDMGVSDVHQESLDLPPQQVIESWEVSVTGQGRTVKLESVIPSRGTPGTPNGGAVDLEAVYCGLGTEADFMGRDVKGKAVFLYAEPLPGAWKTSGTSLGAGRRAEERGAAAVFLTIGIPGNFKSVVGSGASRVPGFTVGSSDGTTVREMIEKSAGGPAPRVHLKSVIDTVSGEKTSLVWGVIPGMSDEKIIINAHRDGYFEAVDDNATGVATSLGLAEFYAKMPRSQRKRTVVIVSNPGHHNTAVGNQWLTTHKDTFFAKAALLINSEHTGQTGADMYGKTLLPTNTPWNFDWYAGGGAKLEPIAVRDWNLFGISRYLKATPSGSGDLGALDHLAPSIDLIQATPFYHTDHDTVASVSLWGLEAATRSYAKIIDDLAKVPLSDLAWPPGSVNPREQRATDTGGQ